MASKHLIVQARFSVERLRATAHRAGSRLLLTGWSGFAARVSQTRAHGRVQSPIDPTPFDPHRSLVLVVDVAPPTPDRDSGSLRLVTLLRTLREAGLQPVFATDDFRTEGGELAWLQSQGIAILPCRSASEMLRWIEDHSSQLTAVVASRHYTACHWLPAVRAVSPRTRCIFDTVDLHFLREQREGALHGHFLRACLARLTRHRELRAIRIADSTWVVSTTEAEIVASLVPDADVQVVSNAMDVLDATPGFDQRKDLLFIGGFRHSPNVDAVRWLLVEIFPLVRKLAPEIELDIVGSDMPPDLEELARQSPGVRVQGHVPDITPLLLTRRIGLAPLRFGAGVKGKINSSMAHGQPVVATPCAIEGMHLTPGINVIAADNAMEFAQNIVKAYYDVELWSSLSVGGLHNVSTHFSRGRALQTMLATFNMAPEHLMSAKSC